MPKMTFTILISLSCRYRCEETRAFIQFVFTFVCVCVCVNTHTYIHTYLHTCIHTLHTYINTLQIREFKKEQHNLYACNSLPSPLAAREQFNEPRFINCTCLFCYIILGWLQNKIFCIAVLPQWLSTLTILNCYKLRNRLLHYTELTEHWLNTFYIP